MKDKTKKIIISITIIGMFFFGYTLGLLYNFDTIIEGKEIVEMGCSDQWRSHWLKFSTDVHIGYNHSNIKNDTLTFYLWNITDYNILIRYDSDKDYIADARLEYNITVTESPTIFVVEFEDIINPRFFIDSGYTLNHGEFVTWYSDSYLEDK